jgi:hypothetical protein
MIQYNMQGKFSDKQAPNLGGPGCPSLQYHREIIHKTRNLK